MLGYPGSIMSLYGPTFHATPIDLCVKFQCDIYTYIYKYTHLESCLMEINLYKLDKMDLKDFYNYLRVERVGRAEFVLSVAGHMRSSDNQSFIHLAECRDQRSV